MTIDPDRVLVVDVETTGTDPAVARIVEFAACRLSGEIVFARLIDPGEPIPEIAKAVHGIGDEDVVGRPKFEEVGDEIQRLVDESSAIAGYNSRDFDVAILDAELRRAGFLGVPKTLPDLDAYRLWQTIEERTLEGAYSRFVGEWRSSVHRAPDDALACAEVLRAMSERFGLSLDRIAELTRDDSFVDRAGKFRRNEDGEIVFAFGKLQGRPATGERDYLRWMLGAGFAPDTKGVARDLLAGALT